MLRIVLIFIFISYSSLLIANEPYVDDDFPAFLRDHYFEIQGINFFFGNVTIEDVAYVFGKPNVVYLNDGMLSWFRFCYFSKNSQEAVFFNGVLGNIWSVTIISDFENNAYVSKVRNECIVSDVDFEKIITKGGLSLKSRRGSISNIFGDKIKYNANTHVLNNILRVYEYKNNRSQDIEILSVSAEGTMLIPGRAPILFGNKYYRDAAIYDAGLYLGFVGDELNFITLYSSTEGTRIEVDHKEAASRKNNE